MEKHNKWAPAVEIVMAGPREPYGQPEVYSFSKGTVRDCALRVAECNPGQVVAIYRLVATYQVPLMPVVIDENPNGNC